MCSSDLCFLLLRLLRCFSSPGSLPYVMDWRMDTWSLSRWVSPFRDLRIIGYLLLPEAFRSLSRLSSALGAKASALCSFLLGLSDAIALTSDGLLVFFYHCSRSASFSSLSLTFNVSSRNECFTYAVFKVQSAIKVSLSSQVEIKRFELSTPCLQGRCSPN